MYDVLCENEINSSITTAQKQLIWNTVKLKQLTKYDNAILTQLFSVLITQLYIIYNIKMWFTKECQRAVLLL